jgi:hypothetical protein
MKQRVRQSTRSGTRGGSPELSLALALVAHPPQGLHLHDLQRTGVLIEVPTVIGEVREGWQRERRPKEGR